MGSVSDVRTVTRFVAHHADSARGRVEKSAQHFERGGLTRAVRTQKADHLTRFDIE